MKHHETMHVWPSNWISFWCSLQPQKKWRVTTTTFCRLGSGHENFGGFNMKSQAAPATNYSRLVVPLSHLKQHHLNITLAGPCPTSISRRCSTMDTFHDCWWQMSDAMIQAVQVCLNSHIWGSWEITCHEIQRWTCHLTNLHSPLSYNSEYSTCQEETNLLDLVRRTSGKARVFCDTLSGSGIWGIQFSNKPFVTSGFIKFPMWTWWKECTPKVRTTMLLPFDGLFLQYKNKCTPEAQIQSQPSCGQNRFVFKYGIHRYPFLMWKTPW